MKVSRATVVAGLVGAVTVLTAGVALAQSDGVYTPADQRCDEEHNDTANAHDPHDDTERCQNATVFLETGDWEVARAGTLHTEEGQTVNHAAVDSDFNPEGHTPGATRVYFGADDNLSGGEHDGASGMGNGPSDGGAIQLGLDPATLERWLVAVTTGDVAYLQGHPLPVLGFGAGSCADGICEAATTERRTAYQSQCVQDGPAAPAPTHGNGHGNGHGGHQDEAPPCEQAHRDAADQDGQVNDPETCSGPSQGGAEAVEGSDPNACDDPNVEGQQDIHYWDAQVGTVEVQPGVQLYQDPNPEGSPILPSPIPSVYVGTCGAYANGGAFIPTGAIDARQGC
jgi:hypothetical protein